MPVSAGKPRNKKMPELTLVDEINLALARALADDPDVVVFGEDVGVNGGVFRDLRACRRCGGTTET
jgi:hypothetical protein